MSQITLQVGPVTGRGESLKRATEHAISQARSMLEGDYAPEVVRVLGQTALLWRSPVAGWHYRLESGTDLAGPWTKDEAREHALAHLAQSAWTLTPDNADAIMPLLSDYEQRDFASWVGFQRAYAHAPAEMKDMERHAWACSKQYGFAPKLTA